MMRTRIELMDAPVEELAWMWRVLRITEPDVAEKIERLLLSVHPDCQSTPEGSGGGEALKPLPAHRSQ